MFDYPMDPKYLDRTERRVPVITPQLRWMHLAEIIKQHYNDIRRGLNEDSHQVTLFYSKFRQYEINPGELDHTPPCRSRREKQAQTRLF